MSQHLMNTYARQPISFTKGEGAWLFDAEGNRYLDALAGVAVNGLGHAHPKLVKALTEQVAKLIHVSNVYHINEQERLADKLCEVSGMDKVFFCNSGCEANEAAIKLARLYGHNKGIQNPEIIVMEKSFHGRTLATLSATGNRKTQAGFEPLVSGFVRVPFDDVEVVKNVAAHNKNVVAILVFYSVRFLCLLCMVLIVISNQQSQLQLRGRYHVLSPLGSCQQQLISCLRG